MLTLLNPWSWTPKWVTWAAISRTVLARAAVAAGADGVFTEVHFDPDQALCDGPNSLRVDALPELYRELKAIRAALDGETG